MDYFRYAQNPEQRRQDQVNLSDRMFKRSPGGPEPEAILAQNFEGTHMKQFRHGDVIIQQVQHLPEDPQPLPHLILAHGELTGHAHRVTPAAGSRLFRTGQGMFLEIKAEGSKVVHEEHASILLPPGVYRVWRQREYSPEEIRIVRD